MAIRCFVNTFGPVCLIGTVIGKVMGNLDRSTGFSMMMVVSARGEKRKKGKKVQGIDDKEILSFIYTLSVASVSLEYQQCKR
jgi:hypothetical protein